MIGRLILAFVNVFLAPFTKNFFDKVNRDDLVVKTVNLYPNKTFIKIRFWDAPFIEVERLVPKSGTIFDLGCGEGIFTNFLGLSSNKRKIIGVEIDKERIKQANHNLRNVKFQYGNVTKFKIPEVDTVVMFHLLHHLSSFGDQEKLIIKCAKKLKKGGKLIIVEVEPRFSFKYFLAYFTDHFLVPWIFEGSFYSPIFFRKSKDWMNVLGKNNYEFKRIDVSKNKPFSHIILDCTKL